LSRSGTDIGIRIYNGPLKLERHSVNLSDGAGISYRLLSVPFYLAFRLLDLCSAL
jgi:hypothetical protein